jgi:hypothetical protein
VALAVNSGLISMSGSPGSVITNQDIEPIRRYEVDRLYLGD